MDTNTIKIPEDIFNQIVSVLGVPFVKEEHLELNFDQIKKIILIRALKEYCRWFPIKTPETFQVTGPFEFPFPDRNVFSATDLRINTSRMGMNGRTGNPLIDERYIRVSNGSQQSMYGTKNDYGMSAVRPLLNAEAQSWMERSKITKFEIDEQNRRVYGFTNTMAVLEVNWLRWSSDWSDVVTFSDEENAIKLAQYMVLDYFGNLRGQSSIVDDPATFGYETMLEKASTLKEEFYKYARERAKVIVMRS